MDYDTVAMVQSATISGSANFLRTAGYYAAGDGGGALYKRVGSMPTTNGGKIQSADGAWWKLAEVKPTILQFGAVADDSTDNTTAVQNAVDFGTAEMFVPGDGIFRCGIIAVPTTLKKLWGPGTLRANGTFAMYTAWFRVATPAAGFTVEGLTFLLSSSYISNGALNLIASVNARVRNCVFNGGRFSVQIEGSLHLIVEENEMFGFDESAVWANGANDTIQILNNNITHGGSAGNSIVVGTPGGPTSGDCLVQGNNIYGGPAFGIHVHSMNRGKIVHNTVRETNFESISVGGASADVLVANNTAYWQNLGIEVGMSCAGDDSSNVCRGIIFADNVVARSYAAGILVAGYSQDCVVQNNRVIDCNRSNGATAPSAIHIIDDPAGGTTLRTTVIGNYATNSGGGHMNYIVAENATYKPDYSYIAANYGRSMATGTASVQGAHSIQTGNVALP